MIVRAFRPCDAPALAEIFFRAIHEVASAHYSDQQVRAWAPKVPDPERFIARGSDGRTLLVAVDDSGKPIAYADVEADGHIDHLFCLPEVAGRGVAAALYAELEAVARSQGLERLYVEASEPARRFFLKRGFATIERNDFALDGIAIHNFRMGKRLQPAMRLAPRPVTI
jgi:putative acetyltransferase